MLDTKKLKALREAKGWTLDEAARRAGLPSRATWHDYENGRRENITLETLNRLAGALECDPKDLLT